MVVAQRHMDLWEPRRAVSLREARQRTAVVQVLRLVFTTAAVVSVGLLLGQVLQHSLSGGHVDATPAGTAVTMINARFEGKDAHGDPYVITAETARRRRDNVGLIDLTKPILEDAASTRVEAREGVYDRQGQALDLVDDVVMTDAAGYTFTADRARMYVQENRVEGQTPLHGAGPMGEVRADSYEVLDSGDKIILRGHVWTRIKARKKDE